MGNHRFKLSDMMPNAWFYKLKDMNKTSPNHLPTNKKNNNSNNSSFPSSKKTHPQASSPPPHITTRKSYYFPRDLSPRLPDPPRKSSKQSRPSRKPSKPKPAAARSPSPPRNKPVSTSSASFSCRASTDSLWTRTEDAASPDSLFDNTSSPEFRLDRVLTPEVDPDILIYVDENSFVDDSKPREERAMIRSHNFDSAPNFELPRIITKPSKPRQTHRTDRAEAGDVGETKKASRKTRENDHSKRSAAGRRCSVGSSPRLMRLKTKSPRLPSRIHQAARRSTAKGGMGGQDTSSPSDRKKLSGSFAIVKSSFDPQRDFRESMLEMIVEHNIKASKDLEELLACYLSLNSNEYHELIVEVFKQIWFDLTDISPIQVS